MKRQRRIVSFLLSAVWCLMLFAGCGKTTTVRLVDIEDTATASATETQREQTDPETLGTAPSGVKETTPPEETIDKREAPVPETVQPEEQTSASSEAYPTPITEEAETAGQSYVLNISSKKIHFPGCSAVKKMADKNKQAYTGTVAELEGMGYSPCGICRPN